jgi:hypothetical protein
MAGSNREVHRFIRELFHLELIIFVTFVSVDRGAVNRVALSDARVYQREQKIWPWEIPREDPCDA